MSNCLALLMMMFPPQDFMCVEYLDYPVPHPPVSGAAPLFVRSYWPYNAEGVRLDGYGGQCDIDCSLTATGWPVPYLADDYLAGVQIAACPSSWIGKTITIEGYGRFPCWDTFGNEWYRAGMFYHDLHGWGYPVDLLRPFAHSTVPAGGWKVE
jgi:hypothetical protein